jgi:hypothetical protein
MNKGYNSTATHQDLTSMMGHHVYDAEGNKLGTAGSIYQSDMTGAPEWVTVKTGLFGTKESFVPLSGAQADDQGLHVTVHKDRVKDAPRIDEDGHLSDAETAALYRHYGLTPSSAALNSGQVGNGRDAVPSPRGEMARGEMARGAARPMPAPAAERPVIAKETVPVERVTLDTETVRENREVSDTVRREEVEVDDGTRRPRR